MKNHVYKIIEIVGSSEASIEDAISAAVAQAGKTVRNMDWFEVLQTRGHIKDGKIGTIKLQSRSVLHWKRSAMLPIARTRQKSKITVLVSARRWVQQFAPYSLAVLFVPTTVFEPLKSIALLVAESPCGALTFLETQFGKPFTANGFGNWVPAPLQRGRPAPLQRPRPPQGRGDHSCR